MNIIIPMAGRGTRLRPHTLTTPKPLVPILGRPIVEWIAEELISLCPEKVENIGFIIGEDFGAEVEVNLLKVAASLGAKGHIFHQVEKLGTAHAIHCAKELLNGPVIIAFADTLFKTNFKIDTESDGVIFVQKVEDPSAFGVVQLAEDGHIVNFVEKPTEFVSDLAIIGIYYFKESEKVKKGIQDLIDANIKTKGEFQLTDVIETLKNKGLKFMPGQVHEWMDCGNKNAVVETSKRMLSIKMIDGFIHHSAEIENSIVIQPCFIGEHVKISNSIIGPNVSIEHDTHILNSVISNSIIQNNTHLHGAFFHNSMIGTHVNYKKQAKDLSIGDYNEIVD